MIIRVTCHRDFMIRKQVYQTLQMTSFHMKIIQFFVSQANYYQIKLQNESFLTSVKSIEITQEMKLWFKVES